MVDADALASATRLLVRQKLTMMQNRYVVSLARDDGSEGDVVCEVRQKRMAFRERIDFTDANGDPFLRVTARKVIDLGSTYDVTLPDGQSVGTFRKAFARSLVRSTWIISQPGEPDVTGEERSIPVAVLRRAWDFVPYVDVVPFAWPYHFDFSADGTPVMSVTKRMGLRDRYVVDLHHPALDRRLAIAQAVALDALQSR